MIYLRNILVISNEMRPLQEYIPPTTINSLEVRETSPQTLDKNMMEQREAANNRLGLCGYLDYITDDPDTLYLRCYTG